MCHNWRAEVEVEVICEGKATETFYALWIWLVILYILLLGPGDGGKGNKGLYPVTLNNLKNC